MKIYFCLNGKSCDFKGFFPLLSTLRGKIKKKIELSLRNDCLQAELPLSFTASENWKIRKIVLTQKKKIFL
jgi:hypothetical protein